MAPLVQGADLNLMEGNTMNANQKILNILKANNVRFSIKPNYRPAKYRLDQFPNGHHYVVKLVGDYHDMETQFSQGSAHTKMPDAADVLYCLLSDASVVDYCKGPEDIMAEFGYDKHCDAKQVWNACMRIYLDLSDLFDAETLDQMREVLQDY